MNKTYIFLTFYILHFFVGYSQVTPIKDKNWVLNKPLSDEFNGTSVDTAKWRTSGIYAFYAETYSRNAYIEDMPDKNNNGNGVGIQPNRMLRLKCEGLFPHWYYQLYGRSGGVQTKEHHYLYGYYEMRARLPGYFNVDSNKHCSRGLWPTLYAAYQVRMPPPNYSCIIEHNEIDIVEPSGNGKPYTQYWSDDAQSNLLGLGMMMPEKECEPTSLVSKMIHNLPPLYEDFHKFAAECLPDRVIYYFDDVPIHTYYGGLFPDNLMKATICFQLNKYETFEGYNTPLPLYYDVDYFRYYQLNTQYCNTDALIANNSQLSAFVYGVRRNITIGNGTASISLNSGESVTFRATNSVTINGDFTVPLGCELNIIPTPCH